MMTTNLFAFATIKQLRTYVVLEFYCLFSRTSWCVGVLNSEIFFNSFHNRVEFGTIFWRAFGISGGGGCGLKTRTPPGRPLLSREVSRSLATTIHISHVPYRAEGHDTANSFANSARTISLSNCQYF